MYIYIHTVERRWAIMMVVHWIPPPPLESSTSSDACTIRSDSVSSAEVACDHPQREFFIDNLLVRT